MQNIDEARFNQLRLRQRRRNTQNGLVGKEYRSFRHCVHVAREAECREMIKQALVEAAASCEPVNLLCREAQSFKEIERLLKSGRYQEAASRREFAYEELKYRRLCLAMIQVRLEHVELVEIG